MHDMSKSSFNALYGRPALANSTMGVIKLAPVLLALGELLEEQHVEIVVRPVDRTHAVGIAVASLIRWGRFYR